MRKSSRFLWFLVLLLLMGASLRFGYVRVHGLEPDETFTLKMVQGPWTDLVANFANTTQEVDPKLYYVLLYPWFALTGVSEIATRLPNILLDLLIGAVLIQAARNGFGIGSTIIVAILWSFNPALIWVSGMVRMYSLLALLATLTWLLAVRAVTDTRPLWWICFMVAALATAYTHVLGLIVLGSAGVIIVLWAVVRRRWKGLLTLVGIGLLYLPYLLSLWAQRSTERHLGTSLPQQPLAFLYRFIVALTANDPSLPTIVLWTLTALCLGLVIYSIRIPPRARAGTLILILTVVALGSGYLALRQNIFETMYLAYVVPLFLLVLAIGVNNLPSYLAKGVALMPIIAVGLIGFSAQLAPANRDDFRSAAEVVETFADEEDVILVMTNYAEPTFNYYYQGAADMLAPWTRVDANTPLDDLQVLQDKHDTLWLILHVTNVSDPENRLDGWFRAQYPVRTEAFPTGATIRAYDLRPMTPTLPSEAAPLGAVFEGRVALRGYQTYQRTVAAHDERLHPPSGWVHVTLYWEALEPGVAFEAHPKVENAMSELYGAAFTRGTEVTVMHPTTGWQPGQIWRTDYDINLNPAAPPGAYKIVVRVFSPGDNRPWTLGDGETSWVILDEVTVNQ